jgi:hypothetical protein
MQQVKLEEGTRLMLWASGNPSTLHAENENCDEVVGFGDCRTTRCMWSGYVMTKVEECVND